MVAIKLLVLCAAVAVALGKIDNDKTCLLKGSECQDNAECKSTETKWNCLYGTCGCKSGYSRTSATACNPLKTFGQDCENNVGDGKFCDDLKYLVCKEKKCDCKNDNFVRDGSGCKIKDKKKLGEACQENEQCVEGVPNGSATCDATCKCSSSWTTVDNNCVKQDYGDSCSKGTPKCTASLNLECKNNKCACKDANRKWHAWKGMTGDMKMCIHTDSKTDKKKGDPCHITAPVDNKWDICSGSLVCRKCSTDNTNTGFCADLKDFEQKGCSGSGKISASVALLLTAVLAYLAY